MQPWDDPAARLWTRRILDSFRLLTGSDLITRPTSAVDEARALFESPTVVLCHDAAADPRFVYANRAACTLWGMERHELVGMPSRLSAGPDARAERAAMLARAGADGVLRGYSGVRRAKDGSLFEIHDAVVWTVADLGTTVGQAAAFTRWTPLPGG